MQRTLQNQFARGTVRSLPAGERRHYVQIMRNVQTGTGAGGSKVFTPTPIMSRWCYVAPRSGQELYYAKQIFGDATDFLMFNYDPEFEGLLDEDFVSENGRNLNIVWWADVQDRHITIEMICKEVKA